MVEVVTWAMLLGRWSEFARSAVALPTTGTGGRWRQSVPAVIGLQAIAMALADLDGHELAGGRALAIDTAAVGVERAAAELAGIWDLEPWPEELHELLADARLVLARAAASGLEWCVDAQAAAMEHPAGLVGTLESMGFGGDLSVASPGIVLSAGCPCAFLHEAHGEMPARAAVSAVGAFLEGQGLDGRWVRRGPPRQVYRQFDFSAGGPVRDLVVWQGGEPRAGQPLLVPAMVDGVSQPVGLPPRRGLEVGAPALEFEAVVEDAGGC